MPKTLLEKAKGFPAQKRKIRKDAELKEHIDLIIAHLKNEITGPQMMRAMDKHPNGVSNFIGTTTAMAARRGLIEITKNY